MKLARVVRDQLEDAVLASSAGQLRSEPPGLLIWPLHTRQHAGRVAREASD